MVAWVEMNLSRGEDIRAQSMIWHRSLLRKWYGRATLAVAVMFFICGFGNIFEPAVAPLGIILLFLILFAYWGIPTLWKIAYDTAERRGYRPLAYRFEHRGVWVRMKAGEMLYPWAFLASAQIDGPLIYLCFEWGPWVLIPVDKLDAITISRIRKVLEDNIPTERRIRL